MLRSIEQTLKRCLRADSWLYEQLRSIKRFLVRPADRRAILEQFARSTPDVFFVQIGSADGVIGDPLHEFIKKQGWRGILVESVGFLFSQLKENYRGREGLIFENVAISDEDGTREFFFMPQTENPPEIWYHQLGTFFPDNIRKLSYAIPNIASQIASEHVRCMRIETLLQKHNVAKIDLIHIDAEGYDFEILRQVDLSRYRPAIIMFEHKHLSSEDLAACDRYLESRGYWVKFRDYSDTLAVPRILPRGRQWSDG